MGVGRARASQCGGGTPRAIIALPLPLPCVPRRGVHGPWLGVKYRGGRMRLSAVLPPLPPPSLHLNFWPTRTVRLVFVVISRSCRACSTSCRACCSLAEGLSSSVRARWSLLRVRYVLGHGCERRRADVASCRSVDALRTPRSGCWLDQGESVYALWWSGTYRLCSCSGRDGAFGEYSLTMPYARADGRVSSSVTSGVGDARLGELRMCCE